jgi:hypothetical protein
MANVRIRDQGKLTLKDSDNSNEVSLQSPSTVSADQDFIVPNADGAANTIITTNASGTLSFTDINTLVTSDIDWQTGDIKTGNFVAASGKGYFVDTTGGAITATMPNPPSAGNIVAFKDYAGTFGTNNLTIDRNGHNIQGIPQDSIISTNRASLVLVYNADAVSGWLYTVENNVGDLEGPTYIAASGGTETTSGDYKIHTFNSTGTFTVSSVGNSVGGGDGVSYMVIAGGGGGAGDGSGGGGAGGYREGKNSGDPYTASPLNAPTGLTVTAQAYPVTVGAGGPAPYFNQGVNGANSVFSIITSAGGGGAGHPPGPSTPEKSGAAGGSGGGAGASYSGGAGNTPPVSPPQGNAGVAGASYPSCRGQSGGGGGAGGAAPAVSNTLDGSSAIGGVGATTNITGSPVGRAGGGGGRLGASFEPIPGRPNNGNGGGPFGGGIGGTSSVPVPAGGSGSIPGTAGTANTGGGGGGGAGNQGGQSGGSGVVIIRYKYQN